MTFHIKLNPGYCCPKPALTLDKGTFHAYNLDPNRVFAFCVYSIYGVVNHHIIYCDYAILSYFDNNNT